MGFIVFADKAEISQKLTQSAKTLDKGIKKWYATMERGRVGRGNRGEPFSLCQDMLAEINTPRFLVVLTDGVWSRQNHAVAVAQECHKNGIEIIAIGFGAADKDFLEKITTSNRNALMTNISGLKGSFSKIAQELTERGNSSKGAFRLSPF